MTYAEQHTAKAVRARKRYVCDDDWAHGRYIEPGQLYVRTVAFPGHISNDGPAPWVRRLCAQCASQYVDTRNLIPVD